MKRIICIIIALLIAAPALAFDIPVLKGRVNDYAQLLAPSQITSLDERLKGAEAGSKDGAQIVVLTVPSLDGESIDKVRNDVFHAWHLGQAGKDNGVLIVIAPAERKIGIEVGYGLEPVIPDSATGHIIDRLMKPHLKKGAEDWFKALDNAAGAIGAAIQPGEKSVPETEKPSQKIFWLVTIFGLFLAGIALALRSVSRRQEREREAREREALARAARRRPSAEETIAKAQARYREESVWPRTGRTAAAAAAGAAVGAAVASKPKSASKPASSRSDDSSSSSSGWASGGSWGGSSDSGSSYSGGGGDSGGGGSSSDF